MQQLHTSFTPHPNFPLYFLYLISSCPHVKDEWQATLLVDNEIGWGVYGYKGYTPKAPRMSGVLPEDKQTKNQSKGTRNRAMKGRLRLYANMVYVCTLLSCFAAPRDNGT
jgi:hypothetical protein